MKYLYVVEVGDVEPEVTAHVEQVVGMALGFEIQRARRWVDVEGAYDRKRRQYGSTEILHGLVERCPADAVKVLGITEKDLFIPMLSFLFGQAQVGGKYALVSVARLRSEFYHLPAQRGLLLERASKESLHELGHAFGLVHCPEPDCVMSLSTNLSQVDRKRKEYCVGCGALLADRLRAERAMAGE